MQQHEVIIIGAGAAGLLCAITAGQRGRKVLILDHANKPGKKILMSGGGRCNFTNTGTSSENFISRNTQFCKSALSRYTSQDFVTMVQQHNIAYHEKTLGQLFCNNKSKDILELLLTECQHANVEIKLQTTIEKITAIESGYIVRTNNGEFQCESLVIATGGLSIPTMGATSFGYKIAEQFGLNVWPTSAGLVPFTLHNHDKEKYAALSGIALDCMVSCNTQQFKEAMLFTHRGLSGPAMLQISSYWQPGNTLTITLLPEYDLYAELKTARERQPNIKLKNILINYFPKRIIPCFVADDQQQQCLQSFTNTNLQHLANLFQQWQIKPNATEGYRTAEVTLGGVDCNAISSKTFEANNVPGLYFIGEVLDVTGWLGGYNFQWAWASGYAAGNHV